MSDETRAPCNDRNGGHFCAKPNGHEGEHQSCGGTPWAEHEVRAADGTEADDTEPDDCSCASEYDIADMCRIHGGR